VRFDVNVATRPFVNYLPHVLGLGTLAVAAVGLTAWNVGRYVSHRTEARAVAGQLAELDHRELALKGRRDTLARQVLAVDLVDLGKSVRVADSVLVEKSLTWATLLERLEDLLPWRVALHSVRTKVGPGGVTLSLDLQAEDQERYLLLIETLSASPCFSSVYPLAESRRDDGHFDVKLEADYDPTCGQGRTAAAVPRGGRRG
jgi:hypothetical protein